MTVTYPSNLIENGDELFQQLGSFWQLYEGSDFVQTYCKALGLITGQTFINTDEFSKSISRNDIPVYHKIKWRGIKFLASQKVASNILKFGDGVVFGYQPATNILYHFGQNIDTSVRLPNPLADLADVQIITDKITSPTSVLVRNIDFIFDPAVNAIVFRDDPFNNTNVVNRAVLDTNGNVIDTEITLFAFRGDYDWTYLYSQFGYALGIHLTSSPNYKLLINAMFDAITGGTSRQTLEKALIAITDVPLTRSDNETVKYIGADHSYQLVITDKNVYKFNKDAKVIITLNQLLKVGDPLTDSLLIYEFNSAALPSSTDLPNVTVPKTYFTINLTGGLTFDNAVYSTTVTTVGDFTQITFPITGASADVTAFWNYALTTGIAQGKTLAELLDNRLIKTGEPTAVNLPATINPLEFMISNVFRNNLFLVKLKPNCFGLNTLGTTALNYLRQIIPSHVNMLIRLE